MLGEIFRNKKREKSPEQSDYPPFDPEAARAAREAREKARAKEEARLARETMERSWANQRRREEREEMERLNADRIKDPEKAHAMALAGDELETQAEELKKLAKKMVLEHEGSIPEQREVIDEAKRARANAHKAEDVAGTLYDDEQKRLEEIDNI